MTTARPAPRPITRSGDGEVGLRRTRAAALRAVTAYRGLSWTPLLLVGAGLGLFAFVGDELPGIAGMVVLTLTSTGFAWGGAALLAGYLTTSGAVAPISRAVAPISASVVLVTATVVYYGLIVAHGRRWRLGTLEDGSSSALNGLASVGRATAFWLTASVVAGVLLGGLGALVRRGTRIAASVAAGAALGLLAGQGLEFLMIFRAWHALDAFFLGRVLSATASVLLAMIGTTVLLAYRRAPTSWPIFAATSLLASLVAALLWHQIGSITTAI
ncbi:MULTISPECIES: hypothetical protein [Micromonospora]|uniref:Uncharacterized protein n=1 Tax=Micromonospora maris TaxID=1003110 RepID=A0A9X0I306_9ACTN|nr:MULTISPECIES: hypothetical protein [Micromonospora]AEB46658.1 hypothetical protein VAB18032_27926 [Micromonospora maris AB-18-032]KUJ45854.1 hypothetical protein ADL17_22860 [Micromonospora maris]RUL90809.1 hypothetical protein EG812_23900 [Verrucosispora sp. FIM060022]